jgi:radical SAM superfamily enzyme YgiQ (UPF0313 family)
MTEVLLMQPPIPPPMNAFVKDVVISPPLGLCYISSSISQSLGVDADVVDCAISNLDDDGIKDEIRKRDPKILGVSTSTHTFKNALKIATLAKELNRDVTTVLGGPHSSILDLETLQNESVDVVVRQEGELTMVDLTSLKLFGKGNISDIRGITYREKGSIRRTPDRPLIEDLDILPFPARHLLPLNLYKVPATIVTGRGCPSRCIFCAAKALSGERYRVRSPDNVVRETKQIFQEIRPQFLFIADDTFTIFHDRAMEICKRYKELQIKWVCESRVNTINETIIKDMVASGCYMIQFGVESGSQAILDSIRKGITIEQIRKAVRLCREHGVKAVCSFMIPHPDDTWDTIKQTKVLMEELRDLDAQIFVSLTTPFPGTYLYDNATKLGLEYVTQDTNEFNLATPVIRTKHLSVEDIEKAFDELSQISLETFPKEMMKDYTK